jgi:hypothetical protein
VRREFLEHCIVGQLNCAGGQLGSGRQLSNTFERAFERDRRLPQPTSAASGSPTSPPPTTTTTTAAGVGATSGKTTVKTATTKTTSSKAPAQTTATKTSTLHTTTSSDVTRTPFYLPLYPDGKPGGHCDSDEACESDEFDLVCRNNVCQQSKLDCFGVLFCPCFEGMSMCDCCYSLSDRSFRNVFSKQWQLYSNVGRWRQFVSGNTNTKHNGVECSHNNNNNNNNYDLSKLGYSMHLDRVVVKQKS